MKSIWLTSAYLAPIEYYTKLVRYDYIYIEQYDNYIKETYRNRCRICGPHGVITLTVPVVKSNTIKCRMRDVKISEHGNWRHLHWNAIESAYNTTPYFEFYKDYFLPLYERNYVYLVDFNDVLCHLICDLINIKPAIYKTNEYRDCFGNNEFDFREIIHPKKDFHIVDSEFVSYPYYQVFYDKNGFIPNLSIIDMLFNCGPESLILLRK